MFLVILVMAASQALAQSQYAGHWKSDPIVIDQPSADFNIVLEGLLPDSMWTLAGRVQDGMPARALIGDVAFLRN